MGWFCTGFIWLRIITSGRFLWTLHWTFGFHDMLESFWVATQVATSEKGPSSMMLVNEIITPIRISQTHIHIAAARIAQDDLIFINNLAVKREINIIVFKLQNHVGLVYTFKHQVLFSWKDKIHWLVYLPCLDIAVGAFKSGHAVVLKSHPIITFKPTLNTSTRSVSRKAFNFSCTACLSYTGWSVPDSVGKLLPKLCLKRSGSCKHGTQLMAFITGAIHWSWSVKCSSIPWN